MRAILINLTRFNGTFSSSADRTPEKLAKVRHHLAAGLNVREAAALVKVGKTALYQALKVEKSAGSSEQPIYDNRRIDV